MTNVLPTYYFPPFFSLQIPPVGTPLPAEGEKKEEMDKVFLDNFACPLVLGQFCSFHWIIKTLTFSNYFNIFPISVDICSYINILLTRHPCLLLHIRILVS